MAIPGKALRKAERKFVNLASEISNYFPDIDLRFNMRYGSKLANCFAPEFSSTPIELNLAIRNSDQIIHSAVWAIKHLTQRFDA